MIPIELYGANTGNCLRVSIALEEAGIPYVVKLMDLGHGDQRLPEHLARNPMGRVPTIVRRDRDGQPRLPNRPQLRGPIYLKGEGLHRNEASASRRPIRAGSSKTW